MSARIHVQAHEVWLRIVDFCEQDVTVQEGAFTRVVVSVTGTAAQLYLAVGQERGLPPGSFRLRKLLGGGGGVGAVLRRSAAMGEYLAGNVDGQTLVLQHLHGTSSDALGASTAGPDLTCLQTSVFVRLPYEWLHTRE